MPSRKQDLPLSNHQVLRTSNPSVALQTAVMFSETRAFSPLNEASAFQLVINSVAIGDAQLNVVASTGHRIEVSDKNFVTAIVPLAGLARLETSNGDVLAKRSDIILTSATERMTIVSPGYRAIAIQVPRELMQTANRCATDVRGRVLDNATLKHAIGDGPADPLVEFIEFVVEEFSRPTAASSDRRLLYATGKLIGDLVADAFLSDENVDRMGVSRLAAPWQAERAAAYIRSNYSDRLAVSDIAAAAGTGTRALQLAFRKRFGLSPRSYLEGVRLGQVRRLLKSASPVATVTDLALSSGFTHLGRFSRFYFEKYGERPSDTLRRRPL